MACTRSCRRIGRWLFLAAALSGCQSVPVSRAPAADRIVDYARLHTPACPADGSVADEQVAASLGIAIETLHELRQNRRRTNAEICALKPEKLAREVALARTPRPIGAPDQAFRLSRLRNADGSIDETAALRALERRRQLGARPKDPIPKATPGELAWQSIGPGNSGGRIRSIVVDAVDHDRVWVGAVTGGIWHSSDGGQQWRCVTDSLGNVGINWLTQEPGDPSILYATTGEATTVEPVGIVGGLGVGILVSRDRGMTWSTLHAGEPARAARRIVVIPGQPHVLVTTNDMLGIHRSVDGGATWSCVRAVDTTASVAFFAPRFYDLKVDPHNAAHLIAGDRVGGVVHSTDAGATWSARIPVAPPSPQPGRVEVAFAASSAGTVYATVSPEGAGGITQTRLYRSADAGLSWTLVGNVVAPQPVYANYQNGNRSYNNALWVDPTDANHVLAGDVALFRSTNGGQSWTGAIGWANRASDATPIGGGLGPDQHLIVADPGYNGATNKRLWFANDGGVFRSDDISRAIDIRASYVPPPANGPWAFTHLNSGFPITQFYAASGAANLGGFVLGGSQDNGTVKFYPSGSDNAAIGVAGGDGMTSAIDPAGGGAFIATGCCGYVVRLVPDLEYQIGYRQDVLWPSYPNEFSAFFTYVGLDPNDRNRLLMAGTSLWLSSNPWAAQPSRTPILPPAANPGNSLTAFAVAPTDSNTIWAARRSGGLLHKTVDGLAAQPSWQSITVPVGGAVASIGVYIDPDDANVVYVLYGGSNGRNIWRTSDGGAHWQDITGAVPGPVYALTRHPTQANWLFAGAESGLYDSVDDGASWHAVVDGPSGVAVESLVWYDSKTLIAATYGRGMYVMGSVPSSAPVTVIEYYHAKLDHYFITYVADEIAKLDNGTFAGWARTGWSFKAYSAAQSGTSAVCRIYIPPGKGDGHFFGRDDNECIGTMTKNPTFVLESSTFVYLYPPSLGTCAAGTWPVYRVYSNRADANHRYTTNRSVRDGMVTKGWLAEGDGADTVVMCAPQ